MAEEKNLSPKFRAALRQELPLWIQDGLLTEESAKRLAENYRLDNLQAESSRLLSAIVR